MSGGNANDQGINAQNNRLIAQANLLNERTAEYESDRIDTYNRFLKNQNTFSPSNYDGVDYLNVPHANYLYLSTIRGGRKMAEASGCSCNMNGGCLSCNKGSKNIMHIYKVIHIIIPSLFIKYKLGKEKAGNDAVKYKKADKIIAKKRNNKKL